MSKLWAKLDVNFFEDPKIVEGGPDVALVFLFLVTCNKKKRYMGFIPLHYVSPNFIARGTLINDTPRVVEALAQAERLGLIEVGESVKLCGWDNWETASSTDRVKAHRERKKQVKQSETLHVTNETRGNHKSRVEESRVESNKGATEAARELAACAVSILNNALGSKYREDSKSILADCGKLAKAKHTTADVRAVVTYKIAEWRGDEKMAKHLVPSTLLRASKFGGYLDAAQGAPPQASQAGGHGQVVLMDGYRGGK